MQHRINKNSFMSIKKYYGYIINIFMVIMINFILINKTHNLINSTDN